MLKHFSLDDLDQLERRYRGNLINSVSGYKPANLIGTVSAAGQENLAIFSSVVHLGANPALLALVQRPITEFSHTYKNIKETGFYTINHVHRSFAQQAHFTSARFEADTSEFEACQLHSEYLAGFAAPFVRESQVKIAMKFEQEIPIPLNGTTFIIGSIQHVFFLESILDEKGNLALDEVDDMAVSGLETWYDVARFGQFPYAKVSDLPDFK